MCFWKLSESESIDEYFYNEQCDSKPYHIRAISNKYKHKMYGDQYDFMMRRGMHRGFRNDRHPFYRPDLKRKQAAVKRLVDPKEFWDVYENPLGNLMPLLEYFTLDTCKLEKDPTEAKPKRMDPQRMEKNERMMMMMRQRNRHHDFNQEEEIPQNTELVSAIRRQPRKSFEEYRSQFMKYLQSNRESMNKSRRVNLQYVESHFGVKMKGNDLLNTKLIDQKWEKVQGIINKKMLSVQDSFQRKKGIISKIRAYEDAAGRLVNKQKEIKLLKNMSKEEQSTVFAIILYYLALPSQQALHREIISLDENTHQVFRKLGSEQDELKRILDNLPYKESSFYWDKLIDCCREITQCEHPSALDRARIQQFQAEFAGVVTLDTLKKLRPNQWLDNTITSAVIEYLKQIQGANNYHGDNNYRACLFTHSETAIFLNNQRDLGENYSLYEKLIFLVNHDNQHWFVIAAYKNRQEIVVYDSLNTSPAIHNDYCNKIANKLKAEYRRRGQNVDFKAENFFTTPSQSNTSDCGVFSIVNMIWAFDNPDARSNRFSASIIPQMRHSLFLFLLYLGYCRQLQVVPRKDYFDILFRSSIYHRLQSQLHLKHCK